MVNACIRQYGILSVPVLILLCGCGERHTATYPVSGKVVFTNGQPLTTGGAVMCESVATADQPGVNARGAIQPDGTFQLSTFEEGDGAVPGRHRVLVRAKREYSDSDRIPAPVIAPKFERYDTSGLEIAVEERNNEATLVIERP